MLNTIPGNPFPPSSLDMVTGGSYTPPSYSTTEQKTGQKWIDGKEIYFRMFDVGTLPNRTNKDISTGLSNISDICRIEGISTNGIIYVMIPHGANTASYGVEISFNKQNNTIRISTSEDQSSYTGMITLYYTKTESEG